MVPSARRANNALKQTRPCAASPRVLMGVERAWQGMASAKVLLRYVGHPGHELVWPNG